MTGKTTAFLNGIVIREGGFFTTIRVAAFVSCGIIVLIVYDLIAITNINQT